MSVVATMSPGYVALREGVALLDLSARGRIAATGEDRARLLHAMTTNHVQQLKPGEGCYAFFLNAQGRIQSDVNLLCFDDHFLLDTEASTRELVYGHLDRFIIADDVTLEDQTEATASFGVEGPGAAALLSGMGAELPETEFAFKAWGSKTIAQISASGVAGFRIYAAKVEAEELKAQLLSAGAVEATEDDLEIVRHETGKARFGVEFSDAQIPHETRLLNAIHFSKGCYLGQEIVERVRSRGHVNKQLVRVKVSGDTVPAVGTKLTSGGKEAGEVASAVYSPAMNTVIAFAYVRVEAQKAADLNAEGLAAQLIED